MLLPSPVLKRRISTCRSTISPDEGVRLEEGYHQAELHRTTCEAGNHPSGANLSKPISDDESYVAPAVV